MAIKFDLSDIPTGSLVKKADLAIYLYTHHDYFSHAVNHSAFKLQTDWTANSSSWTAPWSVAGGDYDSTAPLGTYEWNGRTNNIWFTMSVTEAVQEYVNNPELNYGFIVAAMTPNSLSKPQDNSFRSSDYSGSSQRPKLTIIYEPSNSINEGIMEKNNRIQVRRCNQALMVKVSKYPIGSFWVVDMQGRKVLKFNLTQSGKWHTIYTPSAEGVYFIYGNLEGVEAVKKVRVVR